MNQMHKVLREIEREIAESEARIAHWRNTPYQYIADNEQHFLNGLRVAHKLVDAAMLASSHGRKITHRDADDIRRDVATGAKQIDLARKYGVDKSLISRIVSGSAWPTSDAP